MMRMRCWKHKPNWRWSLLDYVKYICNEAETLCPDKSDRYRLALNIAETDGNVLGLLVTKECQKRGWNESPETMK